MPEPSEGELTIDELAARAGVPTRTIRFYQAKGALQPPIIRGRVAYYGAAHLERLALIAQLQDRGLRIRAIRDLVHGIDKGELDLAEWLGVEQQVEAPWADDRARTVDEAGLYALTGSQRPGLIADLIRAKVIQRHGEVYLVPSPSLLTTAARLEAAGIDLATASAAHDILHKHLGRAVGELVDLFVRKIGSGEIAGDPEKMLPVLRPLAMDAVKAIFARDMEHALRKLLEEGGLTALHGRRRGRKR